MMGIKMEPGRVVTIKGGKYDGHGAQIRKINYEKSTVQVLIGGQIVRLPLNRITGGGNG